jgi:hypothetical protein
MKKTKKEYTILKENEEFPNDMQFEEISEEEYERTCKALSMDEFNKKIAKGENVIGRIVRYREGGVLYDMPS